MSAGPAAPDRRLFIAVPLAGEAKASLEAWRPAFPARRVRPEDAHVTLCFLGSIQENRLGGVRAAAGRAFDGASAGAARMEGFGLFSDGKKPGVLWAGVTEGAEGIARLAQGLREALAREGFPLEARPFLPHVTLARFDAAPAGLKEIIAADARFPRGIFPVDRVFLYESRPGPSGSRYSVLDLWRLPHVGTIG